MASGATDPTALAQDGSIRRLREDLAGQVLGPGDSEYEVARLVFHPGYDRRPAAIVRPADADEVAYVVALARELNLELAVRSGGHSSAGHGTTDGGIVLDLSSLKRLEVDPEGRVAWAETGLTAGEVTASAATHGLGISFGDTGSVGIGGLTLGGGIGYMVRKHGLTIDHLLGAELVTADGDRIEVDESRHPDLFWAIRGGGGNFGVATRFRYRLHPVQEATGGMLVLPATPELVAEFIAAAEAAPDEVSTIANVMTAPPMPFLPADRHGELVILAMLLHVGPHNEGERALGAFRGLAEPLADLVRPLTLPELYPPHDPSYRPHAAARTMFVDRVDRAVAQEILARLRASDAPMRVAQLRVLGGAVARVPADATAFAHRSSRIMVNLAAIHGGPDEAAPHEEWVQAFAAELRQSDAGAYVNFLGDEGEHGVRAAYPGATWERLTAVKERYDPTNLFRLNQNVAPARA
jgi:FAD/FMN-containing dehydrogenase